MKLILESWRRFALDEAFKKQLVPRQTERDLSRAIMSDMKKKISSPEFAEYLKTAPSTGYTYAAMDEVDMPKSSKQLGVEKLYVRIRPMKAGATGQSTPAIFVGGGMGGPADTHIVDLDSKGKAAFFGQSGPNYKIEIFYDPNKIKKPSDFKKYFQEINSGIKKNVAHELTHFKQSTNPSSSHSEKYVPRPGDKIPDDVDPDKAVWQKGDPQKYPGRSEGAMYLMNAHETQAHVRGFYKQAQKSKGRKTFEQLIDERIKLGVEIEDFRPDEAAMIKKHWMDHANVQYPCAKLLSGKKINPKGCVRLKRGTKFLEHPDVEGRVKTSVAKKTGAALIVGAVLWFLLEDVANAAETHGPPSLENAGIYGKIFAKHGISVIDPTGIFEIVMGLYDVLSAEDPKKTSRAAGQAMGEMFGILPSSTTATSFKWPWEKQTRASQRPRPMHPIGGPKDPRYQPGRSSPSYPVKENKIRGKVEKTPSRNNTGLRIKIGF
tara:strand:- start:1034 stop:2503 length:1470 start_codon:yes stop_codon:yes gene_type:complete